MPEAARLGCDAACRASVQAECDEFAASRPAANLAVPIRGRRPASSPVGVRSPGSGRQHESHEDAVPVWNVFGEGLAFDEPVFPVERAGGLKV